MHTTHAIAPERSQSLEHAHQQILSQLKALKLRSHLRTVGEEALCVQACLYDAQSTEVARGAGKGHLEAARVGALYEALEHYLSDDLHASPLHRQSSGYFASHSRFEDDGALALLAVQQEDAIVCRTYRSLVDDQWFSYPLALTCPRYCEQPLHDDPTDLRALRRYSSNSGTAIGATRDEALLHALNENIERDALSLFLLEHFYYQHPSGLRRVEPHSLDPESRSVLDALRQQFNAEVVVLDISREFCTTTCLAFINTPSTTPVVYGSGTSLTPTHAAWRALAELAQLQALAAEPLLSRHLLNAQRHLAPFARLQRCLQFSPEHLMAQPVEWVLLHEHEPLSDLGEQITRLVDDMARHNLTPGVCNLFQSRLGTTLVQVVIPGLERFFLVSTGNIVVPQQRGRRLRGEPLGVSR
ncbi:MULTISPECIES: YcaO-like family protein [unclassified Pseudomonas]|uniref:YcaO-like family protein n=1 Tax=unclassified Pseudomonas TaxID=196821 RepID=UPI0008E7CF89|nr:MULTISPECIES: YcaO-like family protein [unclassified Pseudomonas]SFA91089.1 ribosomal protein S12 methylthiotransferase accessory factor [Pseudomonas sp. NFPP24]SFO97027.1 ribosomal protein S12 methylthiotransferase accessory factor [Pseudomonas sp. NFPP28]